MALIFATIWLKPNHIPMPPTINNTDASEAGTTATAMGNATPRQAEHPRGKRLTPTLYQTEHECCPNQAKSCQGNPPDPGSTRLTGTQILLTHPQWNSQCPSETYDGVENWWHHRHIQGDPSPASGLAGGCSNPPRLPGDRNTSRRLCSCEHS